MAVSCPWPIDLTACCDPFDIEPDDPRAEQIVAQVSAMLSRLSGYAFGGCRTIRPLEPCGSCRDGSCCTGDCIILHSVSSVTEVRVHGEVVDPALYHFDAARGILCAVPPLMWPNADPRYESVGALEVDARVGAEPDAWALAVANELACELLLSCMNKPCRIPNRATQVTSQGVTISFTNDEIRYALPSVWAWIEGVNPARATAPSRVFSPEADRARVAGRSRGRGLPWAR